MIGVARVTNVAAAVLGRTAATLWGGREARADDAAASGSGRGRAVYKLVDLAEAGTTLNTRLVVTGVGLELAPPEDPLFPNLPLTQAPRTLRHVVLGETAALESATDLRTLSAAMEQTLQRLERLGLFEPGSVILEPVVVQRPQSMGEDGQEVVVLVTARERDVLKLRVEPSMEVLNGVPRRGVDVDLCLRNTLGHGELITGSVFANDLSQHDNPFELSYAQGRLAPGVPCSLVVEMQKDTKRHRASSFTEAIRAGRVKFASLDGSHRVVFETALRGLEPAHHLVLPDVMDASDAILMETLRPSLKCSCKYVNVKDSRDNAFLPSRGTRTTLTAEVAGGLGNTRHIRGEAHAQTHVPLFPGYMHAPTGATLSLVGNAGILVPAWDNGSGSHTAGPSFLSDRFFLGGENSFRGHAVHGLGPRADAATGGNRRGDALGGDLAGSIAAIVSAPVPIPIAAGYGVRFLAAVNAGTLMERCPTLTELDAARRSPMAAARAVGQEVRSNASVGVLAPLGPVVVELSCSVPLDATSGDVRRKFHFGLWMGYSC